jgi:hypothetical protein
LAIIGDEGEDVTALIQRNQNQKQSQLNPKIKRLQLHQKLKEEKNNIYSACNFTRSRYCHHATTERHNDRRNSSHLVKQSR